MDMKRILQALDGASTKPVEGANDMAKFIKAIDSAAKPETLTEGANPHKVSLPVQMAMQHYQQPQVKKSRPALIDKYFKQVEDEIVEDKRQKRQLINQYASSIAQRVLMKEGAEHISPSGVKTTMSPSDDDYDINYGKNGAASEMNAPDVVSVDVPLLIRLLEYAREDAKTDMDLHNVAEQLISLSTEGRTLSMDDYDTIVGAQEQPAPVAETKKIKPKRKSDPCWSSYQQIGTKQKDGHTVPNCVPRARKSVNELSNDALGNYKKAASASASAADKAGDYKKGDKRYSGIIKATKKQFDNDLKKHSGK